MKKRQSLFFRAPFEVDVCQEPMPSPGNGEVLVQAEVSAISPGTEMLFYRDQVPSDLAVDATIGDLSGLFSYPLKYGYAIVGRVQALGQEVDERWLDRRVFVFHPHESHFVTEVSNLHPVPEELSPESAVFLPLMETAVSFLMDAQPMIGERVVLFGQGIVGLLTTAMLATYPLANLVALDLYPLRRQWSRRLGAKSELDPGAADTPDRLRSLLSDKESYQGADLVFELSGNPQALDQAIATVGYDGRVLIGSWYGNKKASLTLGSRFHRSNVHLISSQVSFIAPRWSGRFDQARRLNIAWSMLAKHDPTRMITHRFPISQAHQAYQVLDEDPGSAVQVLLTYNELPADHLTL
jgi:2-desacetyl-2-hydroxyethyl bacteriochlorophyllide A dehydrogenase